MKSLFLRMFLWFCGGTMLVALGAVAVYRLSTPERAPFAWPRIGRGAIVSAGRVAADAYERGGTPELAHYLESLARDTGIRAMLLNAAGQILAGDGIDTNDLGDLMPRPGRQLTFRVDENLAALQLTGRGGASYTFAAILPPRERLRYWWWTGVGAFILTGALLCYLLARQSTAPVIHIRDLTSRFAGGDLTARITMPGVLKRRDEIGGLAGDFNLMAARIESLMKAQRRLIADVSHELRSPITRLRLAVGLLRRNLDTASRQSLTRMELEIERLDALIAQLLTLSRMESLDQLPPTESFDLRVLVREIACDADFEAGGLDRSVSVLECEYCSIRGARDLIRSAVENVVRNALKYTEPKTEVLIRLLNTNDRGTAAIIVEDQGPGVPTEALGHMFEPFYRVDEARDRRSGGAGLGLAIAKQIVTVHGGTIRAANREAGGLEVSILLPAEKLA